ncbi:MAG: hypothetical protein KAS17_05015 [Victivallaceae bacterium]|nr:hypothetical protein [Victivallaceae bacterium]
MCFIEHQIISTYEVVPAFDMLETPVIVNYFEHRFTDSCRNLSGITAAPVNYRRDR